VLTASDKGVAKGDNDAAIFELKKACEEMKPILVFFSKPKDLLAFGAKAQKDPEVDACTALDEDLWKRIAITERAKEFVCVRVNIRKADPRLLARYRVARAPVIEILDFNLRELHFSASPKVNYSPFGRIMETAQKTVEADVKKLAAKTDDTSDVKAAKQRALVLEQREICKQGLDLLDKKKWDDAEAKFKKAVETGPDSAWKNEAKVGLIEVKAGKMLDDAEKLYDNKRYKECKELCEKILKECREARFFTASVQELKTKVEKKLS
jgi:tetratricopeptide (TPR) repeat protein